MAVHYILVGGRDWAAADGGKALTEVMLTGHKPPVNILICLFARPREDWEQKFASEQTQFAALCDDRARLELAFPDQFAKQVAKNDVVFLKGGDEALLDYYLGEYDDLEKMFDGKTVVGSSAGADYLSDSFWTCDWRSVGKGRGLVKASVIPHFSSADYAATDPRGPIDWQAAKQELESYNRNLPLYCLAEGQFVVVEE